MNKINTGRGVVAVVEDDPIVREVICHILESLGIEVHEFSSGQEFLDDKDAVRNCLCLVLDVRLPGMSGLELQRRMLLLEPVPAIIFVTGHGDLEMAVAAMRNGAVDFLQKPFNEQRLLDSVQKALNVERNAKLARGKSEVLAARLACLTPREQEVLAGILCGLRTKEIAVELGIAAKTAEEHRANLMRKMHASTVADLIRKCSPQDH